jgi:hypothetical protein
MSVWLQDDEGADIAEPFRAGRRDGFSFFQIRPSQ